MLAWYLSGALHMAQLMPLPLTASCFSKIQIGFTFLVPAHLGSPGKRAVKRVCVCVCVCVLSANGCSLLHVALRKSACLSEALIHRLDREQLTPRLINQRNAFSSEVRRLHTAVSKCRFIALVLCDT